jgi:hypothetical protein
MSENITYGHDFNGKRLFGRQLVILHHCIEIARKEWGIGFEQNPVSKINYPKQATPRDRRLNDGELKRLLEG